MRRILYREDGGVSVIIPAPKSRRIISLNGIKAKKPVSLDRLPFSLKHLIDTETPYELELESEWLTRAFDKAMAPTYRPYVDTDEELPDRRFRNVWQKGLNHPVEVSLSKAKDQILAEVRSARNNELKETDGLMARANEVGTQIEINKLKIYRQKLRDLPETIDIEAISTVAELQEKYPEPATIESLRVEGI